MPKWLRITCEARQIVQNDTKINPRDQLLAHFVEVSWSKPRYGGMARRSKMPTTKIQLWPKTDLRESAKLLYVQQFSHFDGDPSWNPQSNFGRKTDLRGSAKLLYVHRDPFWNRQSNFGQKLTSEEVRKLLYVQQFFRILTETPPGIDNPTLAKN